jgi:HlyD family secretion protein
MKAKNRKKYLISGAVVLGLLIIAFFLFSKPKVEKLELQTVEVKRGDVTKSVTATGTIQPITQVEVGIQVSGVVNKIFVDFNSQVKQGQLIAELDKTNLLSALTQAKAMYDNASNELKYQESVYNRQNELFKKGIITQSDYDLALYNYNNAKGNVVQRKADLDKAKTNLGYAEIYSPISGVVLSRAVDEGQTVAASLNTPTLFTIARDLKEMQVEANVDEADIGQVKMDQRVTFTVDAFPGEEFDGKVTQVRLNPTTSSNVVTYTVVIKADNPDLKLMPGMTATITIFTKELKNIVVLEAKAANAKIEIPMVEQYYKQQGKTFDFRSFGPPPMKNQKVVWVVKNGELERREVKLGISSGVFVEVIEGLTEGDQVLFSVSNSKSNSGTASQTEEKENSGSPFMPKPPKK